MVPQPGLGRHPSGSDDADVCSTGDGVEFAHVGILPIDHFYISCLTYQRREEEGIYYRNGDVYSH